MEDPKELVEMEWRLKWSCAIKK